jgi:6-phosphogluconolactonase (cycloisomerase 2 family)
MLEAMGSETRLAAAQDAVAKLSAGLLSEINTSLWVYGHRVAEEDKAASCQDIEEVIPIGPVDAALFDTVAHSFGAKGWTPITESIRLAAESLPVGAREHNSIVLVSDGEETCGGDPCAMATAVKASGARVTIHAVGLNASSATRAQLQCIAESSGGTYQDADSAEELTLALEEATGAVSDDASGILRYLGRPSSVALSPDGLHAYVTNPGADTLVVFKRDSDTGTLTFIDVQQNGVGGVDGLSGAFSGAVSPDGRSIYVASTRGQVAVFSRDPSTGLLSFVEAHSEGVGGVEGLDGAVQVAVSHDNKNVYVVGEESGAVVVFSRDSDTGELSFVEVLRDGIGGVAGLDRVQAVTTSPDGKYVYTASNPGAKDDALVVFSRDAGTGALTFVKAHRDGIDGLDGLQGGSWVDVSQDGRYIYVVGRIDDAVAIFGREPNTGRLTFTGAHKADVGGKPHAAALSPDGKHLYVVTDQADTILAFERSDSTGELTFVEMHTDNMQGVDGLEWANSVTLSPDGRHVYVAGFDDRAVAIFARDPATGVLNFVEAVRDVES